jgi:peptidoglycan hydrolase-like protein with peptidoglycan-binding domain
MSSLDALGTFGLLALFLGGNKGGGGGGLAPGDVAPGGLTPAPSSPAVPIAPLWPAAVPPSLPVFPSDAWEPDTPVSTPVVQRAVALVPVLWAQGEGSHTVEMTAGHWVTYLAQWLNGKHGVTAWRLKQATTSPAAAAAPSLDNVRPGMPQMVIPPPAESLIAPAAPRVVVVPAPGGPVVVRPAPAIVSPSAAPLVPAAAPILQKPGPVGKYPGPGAYASNAPYIRRYQAALTWLAAVTGNHDWDPGYADPSIGVGNGVDGKFGASTKAGVFAFQKFNGVTPYDGKCGAGTGAAVDHWLSATQAA